MTKNKSRKCDIPTYEKIKKQVLATNSVTINSVSIAGESVNGIFSMIVMMTNLRLSIVNDTYHPFLFHYYVGVSVGSVILCLMLNVRFLYETRGKKIALKYLDAVYEFIDFDNLRKIFLDVDGKNQLDIKNSLIILKNLYVNGSFCSRTALDNLLKGNHPNFKFDNRKQYFVTKEYKKWLNENLTNVFIVCYSAQETKMVTFTGNQNRFNNGINFITYKLLTSDNLLHAIICSSDIPLIYTVESVDGTNFATDGASSEKNQSCYLQSLINCSYYYSSIKIYGKMMAFFGITPSNNNFLIIHNKINLQQQFEDLLVYSLSDIPFIRSIQTASNFFSRVLYNAINNVPLMSLFLQQPFIERFSTTNMNNIILTSYSNIKQIVLDNIATISDIQFSSEIPLNKIPKSQFKQTSGCKSYKQYKRQYNKYNVMTSNQLISTFLYEYNPPETVNLIDIEGNPLPLLDNGTAPSIDVNICYFDMNIRNMYILDELLTTYLLFKNKNSYISNNILNTKKMGVLSGNLLYNINKMQGLATFDKRLLVKNKDNCDFLDEYSCQIYSLGKDVIDKAYKEFLGPNQS